MEAALIEELCAADAARADLPGARGASVLVDALPMVVEGVADVVDDGFGQCFEAEVPRRWNWGYLKVFYAVGVGVRYCVLLPMRVVLFLSATVCLGVCFALLRVVGGGGGLERRAVWMTYYAQALMLALGAVVTYHGTRPRSGAGQIFAANHTTMLDFVWMLGCHPFSVVGQRHSGFVGFFQTYVFDCLRCLWFDRGNSADRASVRQQIQSHVASEDVPPLCVFPEGTCVNNRYALLFKQGAFELDGVEVHPVAIKYDKSWAVGFWDSRSQSFLQYAYRLMTSWCLVVDIYFLPPEERGAEESPREFAARVKEIIAERAGLVSVPWDGYLKHHRPSERFIKERQKKAVSIILAHSHVTD